MNVRKVDKRLLAPVLAGFFIMGFCDIVAPITGRIAAEFPAAQQGAVNFLPTMVFLWFLLLSTPVAALMNRIGRKATALLGYGFTCVGLSVPFLAGEGCALGWYFAGFGLLGVGNTIVQVAVNPLLATIVPGERMTSFLTVGQIFRNISLLLLAPIVTGLVAATGSWRLLLPIYAVLTVAGGIWLQLTAVPEPPVQGKAAGAADCFRLLRNSSVLLATVGVACFIAADVGIGFISVRLIDNPSSILTTTGFYACRIVGTLVGAWVLLRYSDVKYLRWNMAG
ncbi:MAG: MFS transporter, partial [Alistipes sp.]|nr:MFS transporter [Alistipes sp.]